MKVSLMGVMRAEPLATEEEAVQMAAPQTMRRIAAAAVAATRAMAEWAAIPGGLH
jgi:hypothetical protein